MDRARLLDDLTQNLSESELRTLCGRLGLSFQELAGYSLAHQAAKLFDRLAETDRLGDLVSELIRIRPYLAGKYESEDRLNWLDQVSSGMGWATGPQITIDLSDLDDITERDEVGESAAGASPHNPLPLYEAPTATWNVDQTDLDAGPPLALPPGVSNPYQIEGIVTDPYRFYGRVEARRLLRTRLQNMGSSVIVGLACSGKSSLLCYLSQHESLDPAWRFLFAVLQLRPGIASQADLLNGVLEKWYLAMGHERWPSAHTPDEFARQVRFLAQSGYRPVICLDDFEELMIDSSVVTDQLLETWKALGNAGRLAFVLTSSTPVTELLKGAGFYTGFGTIFSQIDLGLLGSNAARRIVQEPAQQQGVTISSALAAELIEYCGAHPFYLQLGAYHLFAGLWQHRGLADSVRDAFSNTASAAWQRMWQQLSPLQQKLLLEPIMENPPLVVARQYRALAQYGVLDMLSGQYQLFSRAFAAWLAEKAGSEQLERQ